MATKKEEQKVCRGYNSPFLNCVGKQGISNFYNSWSEFDDGKTCYCKKCATLIYKHYLDQFEEDELSALFYSCAKLDIPFVKDVYISSRESTNKMIEKGRKTSYSLSTYISSLQAKTSKRQIFKDFGCSSLNIDEVKSKTRDAEQKEKELENYKKRWGTQEDIDDYIFLEDTYNRYIVNFNDELIPQQQDILCDLCRDRLLLRKLSKTKDNDMITKVQNRINGLMKTLKIDNFEGNQKRSLSEQSFIEKIKVMEETKPIELYSKEKEDYYDFSNRKKYYTDLVLRPLGNTLVGHKDFNIDMSNIEQYNLKGDK